MICGDSIGWVAERPLGDTADIGSGNYRIPHKRRVPDFVVILQGWYRSVHVAGNTLTLCEGVGITVIFGRG